MCVCGADMQTSLSNLVRERTACKVCNGAQGRTIRIRDMLPYLLDVVQGDLVEIGAGIGVTTVAMLMSTVKRGRTIVVIDPWEDEFDGHANVYTYKEFQAVISSYSVYDTQFIPDRHLYVSRMRSQDARAAELVGEAKPLAFAFIDGLQTYEAVLSDLELVNGAAVICVDDIQRSPVARAVDAFMSNCHYVRCSTSIPVMETYLIRRDYA